MSARLAVVPELESELDDLFGRPLSEFTAARNELAKRLKKAGQDEAAARVQALKKPSVPVWAVNQLARRHPDELRELLDAGERLRKAQEEAFGGGAGTAVREATVAERDAARRLTRLAHDLLAEEGRPPTRDAVERIGALLRAAAVQPESAPLVAAGRLIEEVDSTGFGAVAGLAPPPSKRAKPKPKDDAERKRREQELRRLRARSTQLERKAAEAEERADRAREAARAAEAKAAEARAQATEAQAAVEAAEE